MVGVDVGQANWPGGGYEKIGSTGPLVLVGYDFVHCPREGLAAPLCMFYHTTVRLHRNKFYLIYIYIAAGVPKVVMLCPDDVLPVVKGLFFVILTRSPTEQTFVRLTKAVNGDGGVSKLAKDT